MTSNIPRIKRSSGLSIFLVSVWICSASAQVKVVDESTARVFCANLHPVSYFPDGTPKEAIAFQTSGIQCGIADSQGQHGLVNSPRAVGGCIREGSLVQMADGSKWR
ncbi:MAG: hypothetical protein AB7G93_08635 [Bdellovibrionales bacterium]